jgi:hypothetical protein
VVGEIGGISRQSVTTLLSSAPAFSHLALYIILIPRSICLTIFSRSANSCSLDQKAVLYSFTSSRLFVFTNNAIYSRLFRPNFSLAFMKSMNSYLVQLKNPVLNNSSISCLSSGDNKLSFNNSRCSSLPNFFKNFSYVYKSSSFYKSSYNLSRLRYKKCSYNFICFPQGSFFPLLNTLFRFIPFLSRRVLLSN